MSESKHLDDWYEDQIKRLKKALQIAVDDARRLSCEGTVMREAIIAYTKRQSMENYGGLIRAIDPKPVSEGQKEIPYDRGSNQYANPDEDFPPPDKKVRS